MKDEYGAKISGGKNNVECNLHGSVGFAWA
jgi:hypothetical protein